MSASVAARRVHFEDPQQYLTDQRESLRARQHEMREKVIAQRMQEIAIAEFTRRQYEFEELQRREIEYLERLSAQQKERERCLRVYEEQQRRQREIRKQREELKENEERLARRAEELSWYDRTTRTGGDNDAAVTPRRKSSRRAKVESLSVAVEPRSILKDSSARKPASIESSSSTSSSTSTGSHKLVKRRPSRLSDEETSDGSSKHSSSERERSKSSSRRSAPRLSTRKSTESTNSGSSSSSSECITIAGA